MSAPSLAPTIAATPERRGSIVARGLAKRFRGQPAVLPFDLELGPGITGLLGPNGSGKSTFLRLLVGLVPRDAGEASIAGVALAGDGARVRERVSYAPGELGLYRELTGDEHLAWFVRERERDALDRARAFARALELPLAKRVRAYSHGMKRQLLLCAAMAPDVPVRILDEPTEGLDPTKRGEVLELLLDDARKGRTIVLSSHHFGEVDRACDRLVFLNRGAMVADERASDVAARARRILRLELASDGDAIDLAARAAELEARVLRREGPRVVLELASEDARPVLEVLARPGSAPPRAIELGRTSLGELYRDLYGVEGC